MSDRKKPTAGYWITVAVVAALVGYPLSFGPACWITSHLNAGTRAVIVVYRPITWCLRDDYRGPLDSAIRWYAGLGAPNANWGWWGREPCGSQEEQWAWKPIKPSV